MTRPQDAEIQFIEIAAHDAGPWNAHLKALGFHPGARFIGSGSSLFECGTARILVTDAQSGAAGESARLAADYAARHGDGVTRVMLRVSSVPLARMLALEAGAEALSVLRREITDDDDEVAAALIGGPGVSIELFAAPSPVTAPTQEMAVDHMVLAVGAAELGAAVQLYSQGFGMDQPDPGQLEAGDGQMRSVMLAGRHWAQLIVAPGPPGMPSLPSAFLRAHRGPGIEHVAFRVPDIRTAVREAAACGVRFLPIPAGHRDPEPGCPTERLGPGDLSRYLASDRDETGRVTYQATTGAVAPPSAVSFGLVQRPDGKPNFGSATVLAAAAARSAAVRYQRITGSR